MISVTLALLLAAKACDGSLIERVFVNAVLRSGEGLPIALRTIKQGQVTGAGAKGFEFLVIAPKREDSMPGYWSCRGREFDACAASAMAVEDNGAVADILAGRAPKPSGKRAEPLVFADCELPRDKGGRWQPSPDGPAKKLIVQEVAGYLRRLDPTGEYVRACELSDFNILDLSVEAIVSWHGRKHIYLFDANPFGTPRVSLARSWTDRDASATAGNRDLLCWSRDRASGW